MGIIKWYKRDPNAALAGMAKLSLEERGAYNTILDLIYIHDGALSDDEKFICGWLRCDVRVWRRVRQRLLDLGKLYLMGQNLRNPRADTEVAAAQHRVLLAAEAGRKSGESRAEQLRILKGLAPASVQRPVQLPTKKESKRDFLPRSEPSAAREKGHPGKQENGASFSPELERLIRGRK